VSGTHLVRDVGNIEWVRTWEVLEAYMEHVMVSVIFERGYHYEPYSGNSHYPKDINWWQQWRSSMAVPWSHHRSTIRWRILIILNTAMWSSSICSGVTGSSSASTMALMRCFLCKSTAESGALPEGAWGSFMCFCLILEYWKLFSVAGWGCLDHRAGWKWEYWF